MRSSTIALSVASLLLSPRLVACAPFPAPQLETGSAYSGAGGQALGGSTNTGDGYGLGLLGSPGLFSHNAGNGGQANSGDAKVFGTGTGSAYTGVGGNASGGNVNGPLKGSPGRLADVLSVGAGNAGDGGQANSGDAIVTSAGNLGYKKGSSKAHINYPSDDDFDLDNKLGGWPKVHDDDLDFDGKLGGKPKNSGASDPALEAKIVTSPRQDDSNGGSNLQANQAQVPPVADAATSVAVPTAVVSTVANDFVTPVAAPAATTAVDVPTSVAEAAPALTESAVPPVATNAVDYNNDGAIPFDNFDKSVVPDDKPDVKLGEGAPSTVGNSYSGAGGLAQGGSVKNANGLINIFSNNAGNGGDARSGISAAGDAGSRAAGGASYSGVGGQAPGGSVEKSGGLINIFSGNAGDGGSAVSGSAGPVGSLIGRADSYSGAGGQASGGSVFNAGSIIDLFSHNAGHGGKANSGSARTGRVFVERGDAYTGAGGLASGGSVTGAKGLINILSNNAGNGGSAVSGAAGSSSGGASFGDSSAGASYSGAGGQAPGGSVHNSGGLINILSGNAGDAGSADSGASGLLA